jgi:hypothetical protein
MNKSRLLACPSCSRHVRADERACPFCAAVVPASFAAAPAPRRPTRRLNRAALYAFGATSIGLAAACSGGSAGSDDAGGSDGEADVVGQPAYGCFPPACHGVDAQPPEEGPAPAYGAPADAHPPIDGANDGGTDAFVDADGSLGAAYGLAADGSPD